MKLGTITTILNHARTIDSVRPMTNNAEAIRQQINGMSAHKLGTLFRAIDDLVLNCKLLEHEQVQIDNEQE